MPTDLGTDVIGVDIEVAEANRQIQRRLSSCPVRGGRLHASPGAQGHSSHALQRPRSAARGPRDSLARRGCSISDVLWLLCPALLVRMEDLSVATTAAYGSVNYSPHGN
jgi:hypothetical protein